MQRRQNESENQNVWRRANIATVDEACDLMFERDIRHIPIVKDGTVVGIISDRDIRCYLAELFRDTLQGSETEEKKGTPLRDIMQAKPISVLPDADMQDVIESLLEWKVGAVLVCEPQDKLRGIVSYEDILEVVRDLVAL